MPVEGSTAWDCQTVQHSAATNLSTSSTSIRWRRTTAAPCPQAAVAMDGITNHPLLNRLHSRPHERDRLTDTNVFERSSRVIVALAALVFCLWLMEGPK